MSIMPLIKKSKLLNKNDEERLLKKFYDNLDDEQSDYIGMFLRISTLLIFRVRTFQAVTQMLIFVLFWTGFKRNAIFDSLFWLYYEL